MSNDSSGTGQTIMMIDSKLPVKTSKIPANLHHEGKAALPGQPVLKGDPQVADVRRGAAP